MINRGTFFDAIRPLFGGFLLQPQVDGCSAILEAWEAAPPSSDLRWLGYMLGTTFHETTRTMKPIREYGQGAGRRYGVPDPETGQTYYGRGFVQLTWRANYAAMSPVLGVDLVRFPDLALELGHATKILLHGMVHGTFTGRRLADYFDGDRAQWWEARRIINGLDCAQQIAGYGQRFHAAIAAASTPGAGGQA